ncbi:hypothetical protein TSUD_396960 [Trifolium subterraneum]|uniref:DRBM domain-containing protein n=1 Tax=Trifolium subterraneum TaxID=3900 RepID=A0A2Z6P6A7_TRISU|nr:hypothetical protein TSUD_396960 [Trifolium subterraneum]
MKDRAEISEKTENTIEVYGAPRKRKRMAADEAAEAAEGALQYLKHIGFGFNK